jgi:hypothetical protein
MKRKVEEVDDKVEIEYFSKEEEARAAAAKGEWRGSVKVGRGGSRDTCVAHFAAKEPAVLARTVTGKWVDDVTTPWGAVKEEQRAPFSKIPGQALNYAKVGDAVADADADPPFLIPPHLLAPPSPPPSPPCPDRRQAVHGC